MTAMETKVEEGMLGAAVLDRESKTSHGKSVCTETSMMRRIKTC